jgi:hypothetical protein
VTTIIDRVTERERHQHCATVVLLHTWPDATVAALPRIIDEGARRSWEFVSISDLFGSQAKDYRCATDPPPFVKRVRGRLASYMPRRVSAATALPGPLE